MTTCEEFSKTMQFLLASWQDELVSDDWATLVLKSRYGDDNCVGR